MFVVFWLLSSSLLAQLFLQETFKNSCFASSLHRHCFLPITIISCFAHNVTVASLSARNPASLLFFASLLIFNVSPTYFLLLISVNSLVVIMVGVALTEEDNKLIQAMPLVVTPRQSFSLAVKILSARVTRSEHLLIALSTAQRKEFTFHVIQATFVSKDNLFMFEFDEQEDLKKVWHSHPWSFDNRVIIFRQSLASDQISSLAFDYVDFYMQISYLPYG